MSDLISKEEVYNIVEQFYEVTAKSIEPNLVGSFLKDELRRFCDLINDQVKRTNAKPFELNYSEDQYIRGTFN